MNNSIDLSQLLERFKDRVPGGGAGFEVGVHTGRATALLANALEPSCLVLIDAWATDPAFKNRAFAPKLSDDDLAKAEAIVASTFGNRDSVEIRKGQSSAVLTGLKKRAFDWGYLDGCKYYAQLVNDLELCLAALKPGGIIFGAGLTWGPQLGFPVRAALHAVARRLDPSPELAEHGDCFALLLPQTIELKQNAQAPRFLVVSTMKNEAPFILEWIAHYQAIGFTDFLIYTNDCDDTTDQILQRLTERGIVRHEPNHVLRRGPHKSALKYAQDHWLVAQSDWVLICDVDEFLNFQNHDTIQDYLASLPGDTDMVAFPWQVFGCGGRIEFEDLPVSEQFTLCEAAPRDGGNSVRDIKTIFRRPLEIDRFGLHRPRFHDNVGCGFVWRTPTGVDISNEMNTTPKARSEWKLAETAAYMNHYPIRSIQSYLVKKLRGRANHIKDDLGEDYFRRWNLNDMEDCSIDRFRAARKSAEAALHADAETAKLHKKGVRQTRNRIDELLEQPAYKDLYDKIIGAPRSQVKRSKRDKVRRQMLGKLPTKGVGAEIGVWEGRFSHDILDVAQPTKLHLIDPWLYLPEFRNVPFGRKRNANRMAAMYAMVKGMFYADSRVEIHRARSDEVLMGMADNSLDWVYIDGNPNPPFFARDLELAMQKVRPGGIIAGDDYYWKKDEGAPIKSAVDAFVADIGDGCSFELIGQQFMISLK